MVALKEILRGDLRHILPRGKKLILYSNIKAVMTALSTAISATVIRADQQGAAPVYPYGTWKTLSNQEEAAHSNIIERLSTGVLKTYSANKNIISFNFIDANRVDRILTLS